MPENKHNHHNHHKHSTHSLEGIIGKLLPTSVYNPETRKILGFLSAEDLLLVALIFLFLDSDEEGSNLTVLALAFVLLSDYIDLSSFNL